VVVSREHADRVLAAVIEFFKGTIQPFGSFEPEATSIPLGPSIADHDVMLFTSMLIVLAYC